MTGQSGQKTTGRKISPLSKFVSTPRDGGEKVRQGAGDPLYEITEVNNGISLSLRMGKGRRIALRITKFRNNFVVTLADRTALDHSRSRESSPIVRGPSPIGPSRKSLNVHRIFLCRQRKKASIGEHLLLSIRVFPFVPSQLHEEISRTVYEVLRKSTEKKKILPPEIPFEGLDGLPVS